MCIRDRIGVSDVALGEIGWALIRGAIYATMFLLVMFVLGFVRSPLAILALPAATLIGFAFAGAGMAATTFLRTWQDLDMVQLVILPLFLFSATFYPLDTYPDAVRLLVQLTPLYHGVDLIRSLTTGIVGPGMLVHVAYLAVMGLVGLVITSRRLERLLLKEARADRATAPSSPGPERAGAGATDPTGRARDRPSGPAAPGVS